MTQEEMESMSEEALKGIRVSIGLFPDEVLRKCADAMDTLIQERGTDPTTAEWTADMMTVLGMLGKTGRLLYAALMVELESTH